MQSTSSINLYVSTQGDDDWSGLFPQYDGKGSDGPVLTLQRAQLLVQHYIAAEVTPTLFYYLLYIHQCISSTKQWQMQHQLGY